MVPGLLRCLAAPKVAGPLILGAAYLAGLVIAGRAADLWDTALVGETVLWFVISATGMMFSLTKLDDDPRFFTHLAVRTLAVSGFVAGVVNLFVFPLWAELILAPILGLLAGVTALAAATAGNSDNELAGRVAGSLLALIGVGFLVYVVVKLASDWSLALGKEVGRDLALPVWLSLGWLPYLFVTALFMVYELAFMRIGFATDDADARRRASRAVLLECRLNVHDVAGLGAPWLGRLVRARSMDSARRLLVNYKRERARGARAD